MSLHWKLNRLRAMSPAEWGYRARQRAAAALESAGIGLAMNVPAARRVDTPSWIRGPHALIDPQACLAAAESVMGGRFTVFALKDASLGFPPDWNRDPKSDRRAPLILGKNIDYRREDLVGDIKYLWEPNRHLELVTLAQAWQLQRDPRHLQACGQYLQSWFAQCPYPMGANWSSALEVGLRLVNWAFAWHLLGGWDSRLFSLPDFAQLREEWLQTIYRSCHFIEGYTSQHSSANNHLLGELLGLFVASTVWPCWPRSATWLEHSLRRFSSEALLQNHPDGVNAEQAFYYQHEVLDMMLLALDVGEANGVQFEPRVVQRIEAMAEFICAMMDHASNMPMVGDGDDAVLVKLSHEANWDPYAALLAACAVRFERADFKRKAARYCDKNRWLYGDDGLQRWEALAVDARGTPRLAFPDGGYYLLGSDLDEPAEVRILVDCGPLGYLSIAAHGHADALSFSLSIAGNEVLIDPGTYTYHTQPDWRNHFRGTAAHNTVRIDGMDQSVPAGNFLWLRKANARLRVHDPHGQTQVFEGEHDGYLRLDDPVLHRRRIEYTPAQRLIVVTDTLMCKAVHDVELWWQWGEHLQVELAADAAVHVRGDTLRCRMCCGHPGVAPTLYRGSEVPRAGWVSRAFDVKVPAPAAVWRGRIVGTSVITTRLTWLAAPAPADERDERSES